MHARCEVHTKAFTARRPRVATGLFLRPKSHSPLGITSGTVRTPKAAVRVPVEPVAAAAGRALGGRVFFTFLFGAIAAGRRGGSPTGPGLAPMGHARAGRAQDTATPQKPQS